MSDDQDEKDNLLRGLEIIAEICMVALMLLGSIFPGKDNNKKGK